MTQAKLSADVAWSAVTGLLWLGALFSAAVVIGFVVLVALFKLKVLSQIDILFYRGLILIAASGLITLVLAGLLAPLLHARLTDAFTAAVLSMSLNLAFLVIMPVTIDRSITVFMLGYMDQHSTEAYSAADIEAIFSRVYLGDYRQIERRVHEQLLSRNIERVGDRYRISDRGAAFVSLSRSVAWLFDTDPRFVRPADSPPAAHNTQRLH